MQAHLALAAFLKAQVSRARLPGLSGGRGRYYSMWNPPLTSAAFDSTQQVLPSFKRHIFFPFFLTSTAKPSPVYVKANGLDHIGTTGWMDGWGWVRFGSIFSSKLNLVQNDQNPHFFASASFDIILVPSLKPILAPEAWGTSGLYDTSLPFTHRFAQFVRRFETVEKLRHGSCLGTLPEPIAQPRVPDICLSDNGNGALGALDTSSNSISGTWPRLPLAGPISTPLLALSELAVPLAVLRSVSALRSRYVGRYAMAPREITKRSMLGKARKHNRL
ncbi:hypothetical protein CABS01_00267 [Colletotrichum abscissum]|uniref:Uncharacterized protein n=1 Tax=Colletotrichum abscissum TaxID=1671311 RepID=A0A9Q0B071_9PEZI|nr:uncharacterized protein CABS01_00267 [Colletotrichum abscissum]KAI3544147.1 hypothetical protein CABS02_09821 [Colletotrichum abscissum]KAK1525178.1 hypothetical protein CABS01_00267 [Colletotrichum abscissum]